MRQQDFLQYVMRRLDLTPKEMAMRFRIREELLNSWMEASFRKNFVEMPQEVWAYFSSMVK